MGYDIKIVVDAEDRSNMVFEQLLERGQKVDTMLTRLKEKSGGQGAGGGQDTPRNADQIFSALTNRFVVVQGVKLAIDAAVIATRAWQYEAIKMSAPLETVLQKHQEIHDSVKNLIRDIPIIGKSVARLMDAFGNDDGLKKVVGLLQEVQRSVEGTVSLIQNMRFGTSMMNLDTSEAPGSEKEKLKIEQERKTREERLKQAREAVDKAKEAIRLQEKMETSDATKAYYRGLEWQSPGENSTIEDYADRTVSGRMKKEMLDPAQKALRDLTEEETKRRAAEQGYLEKLRKDEEQKKSAAAQKERDQQQKLNQEKLNWEREQQQRLDELNAQKIKDRVAREKELINIKYKYEIQRAKEAGMNVDLLNRQKATELSLVEPDKKHYSTQTRTKTNEAIEMRFMSGAYGSGAGDYNYQRDIVGHSRRQTDFIQKLVRLQEQTLQAIRAWQYGNPFQLSRMS